MVNWFLQNLKLNEKNAFAVAIVKDTDYNIPDSVLDEVFDFNMVDPYAIVLLGDREGYDVDVALTEMQSILDLANEKYNRWKDLKLVPEIDALRPSTRTFRTKWDAVWMACNYQYGENDCIDALMIGFLWAIVYGILYIIFTAIVLLIAYPVLFIYDSSCGGLYRKLAKVIGDNFATGLYVNTKSIDNEILSTMAALANKLSTVSRPVKVSSSQGSTYIVAESRTEEDEMVKHYADVFYLCFEVVNHGDQALEVSMNINAI